jgi:hypothetical protein
MTDMLTNELYSDFLKHPTVDATIPNFLEIGPQILNYEADWALPVEKARLMCGEFLYALFFAYRALVGSITLDLSLSREKGVFQPWWNNEHIQSLLRSALLPEEVKEFTGLVVGRFTWLTRILERKFLFAAEEIIDGRRAATDAFDQANSILAAAQDLMKSDRESGHDAQGQMSDPISAFKRASVRASRP